MTFKPENAAVWMEIPVTDLSRAKAFYSEVFDFELSVTEGGPNPLVTLPTADGKGVAGHLYPGKPAPEGTGPTVHLEVPGRLEDTAARVEPAGGKLVSPPIAIPVGRFVYALDPDGNSIGLFQYG